MKTISFKSTVAAVATAATLLSTGIVPVTTASADPIFKPGLTGKIQPKLPGPCANPVLCGPGFKAPPKTPTPPPPAGSRRTLKPDGAVLDRLAAGFAVEDAGVG